MSSCAEMGRVPWHRCKRTVDDALGSAKVAHRDDNLELCARQLELGCNLAQ